MAEETNGWKREPEGTAYAPLQSAREGCAALRLERPFRDVCAFQELHPNTPGYWRVLADYASVSLHETETKEAALLELTAATPDFMNTLDYVDQFKRHILSPPAARSAIERLVYYDRLVVKAALLDPSLRAAALVDHLAEVAQTSAPSVKRQTSARNDIHRTVHDVQHRLAFSQLLQYAGRSHRPATFDEAMQGGTDYVVWAKDETPLHITVKALLPPGAVSSEPRPQYMIDYVTGIARMPSCVSDEELAGRFFIDDRVAELRADMVDGLLNQVAAKFASS